MINSIQTFAGNTLTLTEAIQRNMIHCVITGNDSSPHYVRPLLLDIQSNVDEPIDISIENGRKFISSDANTQNLVVTKGEILNVKPYQRMKYQVHSMCIQAHNNAPRSKVKYNVGEMADEKLRNLTSFIERHNYFNIAAQNAVWVLTDNYELNGICSSDTAITNSLLKETSRISGKKINFTSGIYNSYSTTHRVDTLESEIQADFTFKVSKTSSVQIAMFSKDNIVVKELLYNPSVSIGTHTFTYKYDATAFNDPVYYFKLIIDGDVKINKKLSIQE